MQRWDASRVPCLMGSTQLKTTRFIYLYNIIEEGSLCFEVKWTNRGKNRICDLLGYNCWTGSVAKGVSYANTDRERKVLICL
jgi:hypothetical protein